MDSKWMQPSLKQQEGHRVHEREKLPLFLDFINHSSHVGVLLWFFIVNFLSKNCQQFFPFALSLVVTWDKSPLHKKISNTMKRMSISLTYNYTSSFSFLYRLRERETEKGTLVWRKNSIFFSCFILTYYNSESYSFKWLVRGLPRNFFLDTKNVTFKNLILGCI